MTACHYVNMSAGKTLNQSNAIIFYYFQLNEKNESASNKCFHYDYHLLSLYEAELPERYLLSYLGRAGGWKRFRSQLNNSKTVRNTPYVSIGS